MTSNSQNVFKHLLAFLNERQLARARDVDGAEPRGCAGRRGASS
jgi:hypothetical protein